ncbi:SMI1/KNR4 family protein [Paenibacillus dendritiformis]|uniref:SMI1/KNR4 family protein n=1 Tax=Paenibacillus dendritiformis TaxID=130049 RepID=UPI00248B483D|nr:SMI1/KNR4 family protein [Paenibacillus dendritiformis]WGU95761.1 SMI1/KNR4 family protein [Paenibacillus dendritiformis]
MAASLNPPATEIGLREAEEELGFSLPAELRELYFFIMEKAKMVPGCFSAFRSCPWTAC